VKYIKDYNEDLYNYIIGLRNNFNPVKRKKQFCFLSKFYALKEKKQKDSIYRIASEFMGIPRSDIDDIAMEYLRELRDMKRCETEEDAINFWTTNLDNKWLCLNLMVQTSYNINFYRALLRSNKCTKGMSIYDYGCGCGAFAMMLNDVFSCRKLTLSDLDNYASDFIKYYIKSTNKKNIEWENINESDKNDETYDMVICLDVLEHLEYSFSHLMKLHNRVKKDGILILGIAFEGEDSTHLPRSAEDFFLTNDGFTFLNENYELYESIHYDIQMISGIYIKK